MTKTRLPGFGEIDLDNLDEFYESNQSLDGRMIEIELNFDETSVLTERIEKVRPWLNELSKLNRIGTAVIAGEFASGDVVKAYIEHHLQELAEEDIRTLLKEADKKVPREQQMLSVLKLIAVLFNPESKEKFITLDYTIDEELTDYLVVVNLDEEGEANDIVMES